MSFHITCHACAQPPQNTVETPCCGAIFCWNCVLNVKKCTCGLELSPEMCRPATAIDKLVQQDRKGRTYDPQPQIDRNTAVACPECGTVVTYIHMEEHLALCPQVMLGCPNKCGKQLYRKDIASHVAQDCPLTIVPCPYGCDTSTRPIPRHEIQAHIDENVHQHLQLLAKKVETQEKEIKTLQQTGFFKYVTDGGLKDWAKDAYGALKDEQKRQDFIKTHLPVRTVLTIVLFCLGLLMLSTLPGIISALFAIVAWRKHPKAPISPGVRALYRLKVFIALCIVFVLFQFPLWIIAPLLLLLYVVRDDVLSSLKQIISS